MNTIDIETYKKKILEEMDYNSKRIEVMRFQDDYDDDEMRELTAYNRTFNIILNKLEVWETNLILLELFSGLKNQEERSKVLGLTPNSYRVYLSQIKAKIKQLCSN